MMKAVQARVATLALAACIFSMGSAADSLPQLGSRIVESKDGKLALEVSGIAPDSARWLGVSFFQPGYSDVTWDADHTVYAVEPGSLLVHCPVPAGYEKGSYEVGLWKQRVGENTFYLPAGLRGYATGLNKYGPTKAILADSVAELTASVVVRNGRRSLDISGKASAEGGWLGISFYKYIFTDAVLDGAYSMQSVSGDFRLSLPVPPGYEEGTFEAALWQRLLAKKRVYRLAGEVAAGSGAVGR